MAKKQYFGLKFPLTSIDAEKYMFDVNTTLKDKIRSILMHVIFTPKNQRIRRPDFGTDLIKYIFDNNDTETWSLIKSSIQDIVSKYVPYVMINDINILKDEETNEEIHVRVDYSVRQGNSVVTDSLGISL